jgi:hypothetical protein
VCVSDVVQKNMQMFREKGTVSLPLVGIGIEDIR